MSDDDLRRELKGIVAREVPAHVTAALRVIASHERVRKSRLSTAWKRLVWESSNLFKPLAVPAAGGLLSSLLLFGALVNTLNFQRYLIKDVPIGVYTQVAVDDLSPFVGSEDVLVEVSVDEKGIVTDFSIPSGKLSKAQELQIGNLILYSTFTPATADGKPVPGKLMVAVHHINVRG